ncbi:MAG TPA: hypothetical protein VN635_06490 [Conexibacter sp.]|nr:hypothetical protein [Conexibacter sp.]
MRRLALTLTVAAALFAVAAGSSARNLSFSSQGFRIVWTETEPLVIRKTAEMFGIDDLFHCPVTLEGSFSSATMGKVVGAQKAQITRETLGACNLEHSWFESLAFQPEAEWQVNYEAFTGTLPRITSLRWQLIGFAFRAIEVGTLHPHCLWRSTAARPLHVRTERETGSGGLTSVAVEGAVPVFSGEGIACREGTPSGAATIRQSGSTAQITVTLI